MYERLEQRRMFAVTVTEDEPGVFSVRGDDGDDVIAVTFSGSSFTIDGQEYYQGAARLVVDGSGGNDHISFASVGGEVTTVTLAYGGAGNDQIYFTDLTFSVFIDAGSGDDTVVGSNQSDEIYGGGGNDQIDARGGDDFLDGGEGNDTYDDGIGSDVTVEQGYPGFYTVSGDGDSNAIVISVSQGEATFSLNGNTYQHVAHIRVLGNGGSDFITVHSVDGQGAIGAAITTLGGNDNISLNFDGVIWAGSGSDTVSLQDSYRGEVYAQDGPDIISLSGLCQDATIEAGAGNDQVFCTDSNFSVFIRAGNGSDSILGSSHSDQIYGEEGSDLVFGGSGNDYIDGGAGVDTLNGEEGDDTFYARNGAADFIDGGSGSDTLFGDFDEASVSNIEFFFPA